MKMNPEEIGDEVREEVQQHLTEVVLSVCNILDKPTNNALIEEKNLEHNEEIVIEGERVNQKPSESENLALEGDSNFNFKNLQENVIEKNKVVSELDNSEINCDSKAKDSLQSPQETVDETGKNDKLETKSVISEFDGMNVPEVPYVEIINDVTDDDDDDSLRKLVVEEEVVKVNALSYLSEKENTGFGDCTEIQNEEINRKAEEKSIAKQNLVDYLNIDLEFNCCKSVRNKCAKRNELKVKEEKNFSKLLEKEDLKEQTASNRLLDNAVIPRLGEVSSDDSGDAITEQKKITVKVDVSYPKIKSVGSKLKKDVKRPALCVQQPLNVATTQPFYLTKQDIEFIDDITLLDKKSKAKKQKKRIFGRRFSLTRLFNLFSCASPHSKKTSMSSSQKRCTI